MTSSAEAPSERSSQRRYPDFFIVGHAKSGTTALYEMLRRHPGTFMPSRKEPQFFARNPAPAEGEPLPLFEQTGLDPESLDDYLSLFAPARPEELIGEGSTFYLFSPIAPARIAAAQPQARIIAILREPASFLRSLHLQMIQNQVETERDLRAALALEDARRDGRQIPPGARWPRALIYSDRVRYVEQLRRFRAAFGAEHVLVLIYDDFLADNEGTVRRVLRFLGVEDEHPLEPVNANPTVAVRSLRLAAMWRTLRTGQGRVPRAARRTIKALTSSRLRRSVLYPLRRRLVYAEAPRVDEALMAELRSRFKPEVVALSEYLGRDLVTLWGYDAVV
jgi:hypothetical protein